MRLLVHRTDLLRTRLVPDPDASVALREGQARLAMDCFALTANNITYAAFGESMKYWQFFPAAENDRGEWGCLPVWGFAEVVESHAEGLLVGERIWGYYPAGTNLVVRASRVGQAGFTEGSAHRQELAGVYNQYAFTRMDPGWAPAREGFQAVLKPLFITSFLIDDFLADNAFFGAQQLLFSSASSKTAFGTAFCLARRRGAQGLPRIVGLTSPGNVAFARALGCYDEVRPYPEVGTLSNEQPAAYIDFAGDARLRRVVHEHFGERALMHSASIGGTHWQALGGGGGLPGPRPELFFAPAQVKRRSAPPPHGWGPALLQERLGEAWVSFVSRVVTAQPPWVQIENLVGPAALEAAYRDLLGGRVDPSVGLLISPSPASAAGVVAG
ncbi:MAG: DUF2855 family protein [Rubrivivax sp.]|nr:DUF2855 family protein [Rubrivivax sp.]